MGRSRGRIRTLDALRKQLVNGDVASPREAELLRADRDFLDLSCPRDSASSLVFQANIEARKLPARSDDQAQLLLNPAICRFCRFVVVPREP